MTNFVWTDEQRDQIVPGATVVVHLRGADSQRREIRELAGLAVVMADGVRIDIRCCDPESLNVPPDARQLGLFGGSR